VANTLVISTATFQLLGGFFACQPLGTRLVKGLTQPLAVYRVLYESMARSRLEAVGSTGLTPLVGREQEVRLLLERWEQVKDGSGQVVLLSGEATSRPGAERTGSQRAAGVADAVPVFALLSAQRLVSVN
jgi:class 3 adenylate cyclase